MFFDFANREEVMSVMVEIWHMAMDRALSGVSTSYIQTSGPVAEKLTRFEKGKFGLPYLTHH